MKDTFAVGDPVDRIDGYRRGGRVVAVDQSSAKPYVVAWPWSRSKPLTGRYNADMLVPRVDVRPRVPVDESNSPVYIRALQDIRAIIAPQSRPWPRSSYRARLEQIRAVLDAAEVYTPDEIEGVDEDDEEFLDHTDQVAERMIDDVLADEFLAHEEVDRG